MKIIGQSTLHGGAHKIYKHQSKSTNCEMEFAVFMPPGEGPFPCLYYLSGLTCTWENAATKSMAQAYAAKAGIALVFPDTSPRGEAVADVSAFSLGKGAGYYMGATEKPWAEHYKMDHYITHELPEIIPEIMPINSEKIGITGHSMGGHGALTLAMKNPQLYKSVSAFAPICALSQSPWGKIAIDSYRGGKDAAMFDACALMENVGWSGDILVDQGKNDEFMSEHLMPQKLAQVAEKNNINLTMRLQNGYDHSYWFVSSFIADHIQWHAERLK